jgi:uncharacterized protein (TIGR00297 family)
VTQLAIGAVAAAAIAAIAYFARSLTISGAYAAFAIGTIVFGFGGPAGAAVLLAFFVSSSLLSALGRSRKRGLAEWGKQGPRDARQVIANGGIAALCVGLHAELRSSILPTAFAGAFAAAAADTWATEVGTLSKRARSILTFAPVPRGSSGGISLPGSIAQVAGAAFVAFVAVELRVAHFLPVFVGGVAGGIFDSVLGATLQSQSWCPRCSRTCETTPHPTCGTIATRVRGLAWMDNDAVNLAATSLGAAIAALAQLL